MLNKPVTAAEREALAKELEIVIIETLNRLGFRSGAVVHAIESASKMVSSRVNERKCEE
jgi:hypothetical protein